MQTFTNKKGQNIGYLKDGIFRKRVSKKKHLMKMFDGWGLDYELLEQLGAAGATEIRILDTDEDIVYAAPIETFMKLGIVRNFDGQQVFLPRKHFTKEPHNPSLL